MRKPLTQLSTNRREFLRHTALASGAIAFGAQSARSAEPPQTPTERPNILMICADQFRPDFVGANHENPSARTPHLDKLASRGVNFRQCVANQPLCSPSRASFLTSRYATEAGMWKLGLELDHSLPTIATELRRNGYGTHFMGKWHISQVNLPDGKKQLGWIAPGPSRAGFDDLWEGANVIELISHPYAGHYWADDGTDIGFSNEYRVDFIANRGVKFIEQKHDKPWLLFLSQLEPHHQNDIDAFVPPLRYADDFSWRVYRSQLSADQQKQLEAMAHPQMADYSDPYIPHDLRNLPGNWRSRIPGYYGCVQAIDDCVGSLVAALERTNQLDKTIIVFFSDHGCTFRTRLGEYKRSPHESSLRVPFIIAGPGFDQGGVVDQLVSLLDLTPTLLDGAGIQPPASMRGHALRPLLHDPKARDAWDSTAYFQISQSICGRGIRTPDWCYCAFDPSAQRGEAEYGANYQDFALYSISGDPAEMVNLVGREEYRDVADMLRRELEKRIVAAGEPEASITPVHYYA
ncbi:MAG TPA: sulfatase-like hydrolase/transferase [Terracidiphilus sp.]|nr:sulfatase-like hydrolase/transferase [Terracidiphilus sp.]HEV2463001.1 sulfatase-like hydrolase/transferase [Acidobacteriaceae bacterium]